MTPLEEKLFEALAKANRRMPLERAMMLVNRETSGEPTIGTENPDAKVKFVGLHFEYTLPEKLNE